MVDLSTSPNECFELVTDCSYLVAKVLSECTGDTRRKREVHAAMLLSYMCRYCVGFPTSAFQYEYLEVLLCSLHKPDTPHLLK